MKHIVATFDKNKKCLYREDFPTAEMAYEAYTDYIRVLRARLEKGEEVTVVRFNDGYVMTMETIVGTH